MITINKGTADFNQVKFVLRARAKTDFKPVYTKVHVVDGYMHATDSYRMHYAKIESVEDGLYDVITNTAKQIVLNDCTDNLHFPSKDSILRSTFEVESGYGRCNYNRLIRVFYTHFTYESKMINVEFIKDLFIDEHEMWKLSIAGEDCPVYFSNSADERFAILMTMNFKA